ncbi:hypothetical protein A3B42_04945 [Candidatus Daviesbacteria bacterium RIFCSPLOWO2_01_FULL_38_10]|uniref:Uncharacterized protein n=1 Tax=Candidatus Daviesbacteria bacterium GW2011_GWF2_38_6 TaxID=1618432 RepID=A0A0G0KTB0_9BACT|nr:MAG: hypothetical protein US80_C0004G0018 [Candidatus Daviesbacteria bacterium GW2011_GWA2_38_17]KKQ78755.1 MAG: hypothetical protein US99_C0012G0012 [Candidatus Daviesbacteria bacterium GW2011_GWF2_38_6]OGE27456.1 MAG: hypothetical protein A3D02_03590 [Candidatus Daviesbacteria bacterium RIFCSPHIGHO2_02_FULL_39_41]OGE29665.1 MAG: hypothetical protein A2772_01890 [Candidatus Daviesbacteria bacterium RIFCSPHIGHO2_01_FULL_38_8b]OGE39285.1 MAG: hypothetical protein A3B42_04945 [Candidatus Davie
MLNVRERIDSYSDKDLAAMRAGVKRQQGNLLPRYSECAMSAGPALGSLLEVLTGEGSDKLGRATVQDFANLVEIGKLERRMDLLNLLGRRMDLEADRRMLMGVVAA